jgi:hypothetical protein
MDALKTIYYSIFHYHKIYAIQLWSCASSNFLFKVVCMQKQAYFLIQIQRVHGSLV